MDSCCFSPESLVVSRVFSGERIRRRVLLLLLMITLERDYPLLLGIQ